MRSRTDPLRPSLRNHSYLVALQRLRLLAAEVERLRAEGRTGLTVLDVGSQSKPYAPILAPIARSHIGLDLTPDGDVVADATRMPFADGSVDLVLCTQVLTHLPEPAAVVAEIHRVLKPGGVAVITVPSVFPLCECPRDYWRFMPDGLRHLLAEFSDVRVLPETNSLSGFFRTLNLYFWTFSGRPWGKPLRRLLLFAVFPVTNLVGRLAQRWSAVNDHFAVSWMAVACK